MSQEDRREKVFSPSPSPSLEGEVWGILKRGLDSLSDNDYGRPWPLPSRSRISTLAAAFDYDLCIQAAWEAREIVQSQDRAPNITSLYQKKLEELAEVRETVRRELA